MYWLISIGIIAVSLFLVWASADIGSNIYLKTICKGTMDKKFVVLTFDDGPDPDMTPLVLTVLKEYNVKATFFLVGCKVDKYPEIVKRIIAEGHSVGNHTYSHQWNFPLGSMSETYKEVLKCNESLELHLSQRIKWFRPPFGVTNPIIGKVVKAMNLIAIGWSIRSLDTRSDRSRERVCENIIRKLHPGAIVLLHDRCKQADGLLRNLIQSVLGLGYTIVPLDKLIGEDDYEK